MAYQIAVLVGSLRKESYNRKLARALERLAQPHLSFHYSRIDDLPLFNQDYEQSPPAPVRRLKDEIKSADGVLFVTPEYNRSVPGVLKNAIDHASRPYGQNTFAGKPAAMIGTSMGKLGTACAQQHLRSMFGYLDIPALGQPEAYVQFTDDLIDSDFGVTDESTHRLLLDFVNRFCSWVEHFAGVDAVAKERTRSRLEERAAMH